MATLKDIAKAAGVSISTASRALGGNPRISLSTRKAVQEAARQLNYRGIQPVNTEPVKKIPTLAVIVPNVTLPSYAMLLSGIQDAAVMQEYNVMIFGTENDTASEKKALDMILCSQVSGVIVAPPETEVIHCGALHEANLPVVYAGYCPAGLIGKATAILPDHFEGAALATQHLIQYGHTAPVLITGPDKTHAARERVNGYIDIMRREGLAPSIFSGPSTYHAGIELGLQLLDAKDGLHADSIIAANDAQAIGIMHAFQKRGVRVPQDISLISFEDTFLSCLALPELTAVSLSLYRIGTRAFSILIDMIEKKDGKRSEIELIRPMLMQRKSCRGRKKG